MAKGSEEMLVTHSYTRAHVHTHTHTRARARAPEILTPWGCLLTARVTKWKTQRKTFVEGAEIKSLQRPHSRWYLKKERQQLWGEQGMEAELTAVSQEQSHMEEKSISLELAQETLPWRPGGQPVFYGGPS